MQTTKNYTDIYDTKLKTIPHYKNHLQMLPFIGKNYGNKKKLLIIAESHYCDPDASPEVINNWYSMDSTTIDQDKECWPTNTRDVLDFNINEPYTSKGGTIYRNLISAIKDAGFVLQEQRNVLTYVSFMNFFQRPAGKTGQQIRNNEQDNIIANETVESVLEIIKPSHVFFVSSKSWEFFRNKSKNDNDYILGHSCHPTTSWWNRFCSKYTMPAKSVTITGKKSFIYFIKENKIFD